MPPPRLVPSWSRPHLLDPLPPPGVPDLAPGRRRHPSSRASGSSCVRPSPPRLSSPCRPPPVAFARHRHADPCSGLGVPCPHRPCLVGGGARARGGRAHRRSRGSNRRRATPPPAPPAAWFLLSSLSPISAAGLSDLDFVKLDLDFVICVLYVLLCFDSMWSSVWSLRFGTEPKEPEPKFLST